MNFKMLKKAMITYVNFIKAIWSEIAYPLSIIGGRNSNLEAYRIYGNSIQEGTPSPENPAEVQSVGELVTEGEYAGKYKIPVLARGKNLLKAPLNINSWKRNSIKDEENYAYTFSGMLPVGESVTLSFGFADESKVPTFFYFMTDDSSISANATDANTGLRTIWITTDKVVRNRITFTPKEGKIYAFLNALGANSRTEESAKKWLEKFSFIQIETGKEATEFEEYIEPKIVDIYLNEPIRKIGDYSDYIDFENKIVARRIIQKEFNDLSWAKGDYTFFYASVSDGRSASTYCISNVLPSANVTTGNNTQGINKVAGNILRVRWDLLFSTLSDWKTFINNNDSYVIYIRYSLKEEEIELPTLPQFKGTTIYEIQTKAKPSGMEAYYYGEV